MNRVTVSLWGSLQAAAGDRATLQVDADDVATLLERLGEHHPGLRPQLARGVSVAVDGVLYNRSRTAALRPGAEVVLLPRIEGG